MRRPRGPGGRFLTAEEIAALKASNSSSSGDGQPELDEDGGQGGEDSTTTMGEDGMPGITYDVDSMLPSTSSTQPHSHPSSPHSPYLSSVPYQSTYPPPTQYAPTDQLYAGSFQSYYGGH